jgi:hypothetical protein
MGSRVLDSEQAAPSEHDAKTRRFIRVLAAARRRIGFLTIPLSSTLSVTPHNKRHQLSALMGIITFPHDSQTGGKGTLADGENRPGQQDLRVFPNGLGKKRLKLYDKRQQLDRQCSHIEEVFWRRFYLL